MGMCHRWQLLAPSCHPWHLRNGSPSSLGCIDTELVELQVYLATGYGRERQRAAELLTQAAFGGARWRPALDSLRHRTSDAAPASGNAGRLKRLLTVI